MSTIRQADQAGQARREEGATMIVVMLVLLSVTSLALLSIHATTFELRAAGSARQAMQAHYAAEAGLTTTLSFVDRLGPQAILHGIEQTTLDPLLDKPVMAPFEPELHADREGYRMYSQDFNALTDADAVTKAGLGALGGNRQPYDPTFTVDVNDHFTYTGTIAGQRSDGLARLQFLHATYTARSRLRLRAGDYTGTDGIDPNRTYHEAANAARAYGVSGPFAR